MAGNLLDALTNMVVDTEATSQLRGLAADASFLSDARKRCASERRLAEAIDRARNEGRPVILVAHSLGSLVAYDYLSTRTDSVLVNRFVTIGSMLGSPVRHLLIGGDSTDTLSRPPSVKEWVNVRNEQDPLAVPISVGRDITTSPPVDEPDAHEMVGYLRGHATASEVLGGWCAAFQSNRPRGCKDVVPK
jgi:predicted alpha/beta hydrolase family esterase